MTRDWTEKSESRWLLYNSHAKTNDLPQVSLDVWNNSSIGTLEKMMTEMFGPSWRDYEFSQSLQWPPTQPKPNSQVSPPLFPHPKWDALLDSSFARIRELAAAKGGEYSGDTDRLANFRRNADALGLSPEQVWAVYAAKHWDALMQYVKDLGEGKSRPRLESIESRIDDLLVYLLLFKAMTRERDGK